MEEQLRFFGQLPVSVNPETGLGTASGMSAKKPQLVKVWLLIPQWVKTKKRGDIWA